MFEQQLLGLTVALAALASCTVERTVPAEASDATGSSTEPTTSSGTSTSVGGTSTSTAGLSSAGSSASTGEGFDCEFDVDEGQTVATIEVGDWPPDVEQFTDIHFEKPCAMVSTVSEGVWTATMACTDDAGIEREIVVSLPVPEGLAVQVPTAASVEFSLNYVMFWPSGGISGSFSVRPADGGALWVAWGQAQVRIEPSVFDVVDDLILGWEPVEYGCEDHEGNGGGSPDPNAGCRPVGYALTTPEGTTTLLVGEAMPVGDVSFQLVESRNCCELDSFSESCAGIQYTVFATG